MIEIKILDKLKEKCPQVAIGCVIADVDVTEGSDKLWSVINNKCNYIEGTIESDQITKIENIKTSRMAYKSLGKDPSRYRLSSESLVKRIVKGMGLYKVNNVVDINNLVSLESFYSVGTYDLQKIDSTIYFTVGEEGERYDGIGRSSINLTNLPVFEDKNGKFGSTTSDSNRAMITNDTKKILMNIISFNGTNKLNNMMKYAKELIVEHANGRNIECKIIS